MRRKLERLKMSAPIRCRSYRHSNEDNTGTQLAEDTEEYLDYEVSAENDNPNNCYSVHKFCEGIPELINITEKVKEIAKEVQNNKTKSIGVSEANYTCIWFLNGGIINSYQ